MNRRGSIVLAAIFILLLSCVSFAVLTQAIDHERIVRAREKRRLSAESSRNGLVAEVALTLRWLETHRRVPSGLPGQPLKVFPNRPLTLPAGLILEHRPVNREIDRSPTLCRMEYDDTISARTTPRAIPYLALLRAEIWQGEIPLPQLGVWLSGEGPEGPAEPSPLAGLEVRQGLPPLLAPLQVRGEAGDLLLAALSLKSRQSDYREIRTRLGLSAGTAPPPAGIYPILREGEISALYVQGDVERMLLLAIDEKQQVTIALAGIEETFRYTPGKADCQSLSAPGEPRLFAQQILVNGAIHSLAGGGDAAMLPECQLLIASAGRITVTGHLTAATSQRPGLSPPLTLLAGRKDLVTGNSCEGGVTLLGKVELQLEAHLVVDGDLVNAGKKVYLKGTLAASRVRGGTGVVIDCRLPAAGTTLPITAGPLTLLRKIGLLGIWEETHEP